LLESSSGAPTVTVIVAACARLETARKTAKTKVGEGLLVPKFFTTILLLLAVASSIDSVAWR
jgi:hypothetical protein